MTFRIRIAETVIEINSLYKAAADYCGGFATDEEADFIISINEEDIENERMLSEAAFPPQILEITAVYRKICDVLLQRNIFLMHGSVVEVNGEGYMFTALSGTGKTTHTRLWLKNIPGCTVVNGDKPLIMIKDGKAYACGTPWCGKEKLGADAIVPLKAVAVLERAEKNSIEQISTADALPTVIQQSNRPESKELMSKTLELISQMCKGVKFYVLKCNMENEAAIISYGGMKNK